MKTKRLKTNRRGMLAGSLSSVLMLTGCKARDIAPSFSEMLRAGDLASYYAQAFLLSRNALAREYSLDDISSNFPKIGTTLPDSEEYRSSMSRQFSDYRLSVTGLVKKPMRFTLQDLKSFQRRSQITAHSCEEGWTAIAQWTGTPLHNILSEVGLAPQARFVFFFATDGWWDSIHLSDALHPQTLLAWGMNGEDLPVAHGAPLRLRIERQIGSKSMKFLERIEVTDTLDRIGDGTGTSGTKIGFSWSAGI